MLYLGYELYIWGSRPVSVYRLRVYSRVVVFHTLHRGQRDTKLFPYLITCYTLYPLLLPHLRVFSGLVPLLYSSSPSHFTSAAVADVSLVSSRSIPACSHHHSTNHAPCLLSSALHRSRINFIAIYCQVVPLYLRRFLLYSYLISTEHISGISLYCQK